MPGGIYEPLVLLVGHRVTVYQESIHVDDVGGSLIGPALVAPRQKASCRDTYHLLSIGFPDNDFG
jgi:hypothetical protein